MYAPCVHQNGRHITENSKQMWKQDSEWAPSNWKTRPVGKTHTETKHREVCPRRYRMFTEPDIWMLSNIYSSFCDIKIRFCCRVINRSVSMQMWAFFFCLDDTSYGAFLEGAFSPFRTEKEAKVSLKVAQSHVPMCSFTLCVFRSKRLRIRRKTHGFCGRFLKCFTRWTSWSCSTSVYVVKACWEPEPFCYFTIQLMMTAQHVQH